MKIGDLVKKLQTFPQDAEITVRLPNEKSHLPSSWYEVQTAVEIYTQEKPDDKTYQISLRKLPRPTR